MQNISIPLQTNNLPSHSTTSANTDVSNTSKQSNEKFSQIMEHEVSNSTTIDQQDNNATGEMPATAATATATATATAAITNNADNPQPILINQLQRELSGQFTKERGIIASTLNLEANVSHANNINQSTLNEQTQISDISTVMTVQAIGPILSQPAPIQKYYANTPPGQPYVTANFAANNKMMPPSVETTGNNTFSIAEASTISLISDTAQPVATDSTTILTTSAPPSPSTPPTVFTPPDISLDIQLGQPKWEGEFAQKIVWLASQQQQVAEIRLNPAHLGPIEIMLSITNDQGAQQATAQFVSSHLAVREAIEAALPKLREMMADNGITLGNVTVDSNSSQQQRDSWQQESAAKRFASNQPGTHSESTDQLKATITNSNHHGMVNTFA